MNLRNFTVFSTVAMLALGGCVIVGSNDTGGAGGTAGNGQGGEGNTGNTGNNGGAAGAGVGGTGGTGGGATACAKVCSDTQTDPTLAPCADASETTKKLYQELADCVCGAMGACSATCTTTTYCGGTEGMGSEDYTKCQTCLLDQTATGCGAQVQACSDDM